MGPAKFKHLELCESRMPSASRGMWAGTVKGLTKAKMLAFEISQLLHVDVN